MYDDEGLEEKIFIKRKSVFEKSYYTPQYSLDFIRDFPDVNITFYSLTFTETNGDTTSLKLVKH